MALTTKAFSEILTYSRDSGGTRVNAAGLIVGVDFSVSSVTFGTGAKAFTLAADANVNRDWPVGSLVRATSQASPLGLMNGTVTSYDPATQELVIEVTESTGTGTGTNWRIGSLEFRRDFDPVTLAPRGGLVEGGATNLLLRSEAFDNAYWIKTGSTVGVAPIPSPNGSLNAFYLTDNTATSSHNIFSGAFSTGASGTAYVVHAKADTFRYLTISGSNTNASSAVFDLEDGVVTQLNNSISPAKITDVGNGLYRCELPRNGGAVSNVIIIGLSNTPTPSNFIGTSPSYTGDGNGRVIIWGAQAESAASATSYIPTTTVAVSRAADLLAVEGANFTQAYNQSQGKLLVECIPNEQFTSTTIASINDGTLDNEIRVGQKQIGTRSSIRAIASDGVKDVMALTSTVQNVLKSNGVDYALSTVSVPQSMLAVASDGLDSFLVCGSSEVIRSTDDAGDTFKVRNINTALNGAHYGIGRFVITGNSAETDSGTVGTIVISNDGLAFRRISIAGLSQDLNEVTSNGTNQYVAVGNGGVIYTSSDAEVWTAQVSGTTTSLPAVHFFNGRYVAVAGAANQSRYSDNGTTWTAITIPSMTDVYHNGTDLWVAVGAGGLIYSSADGITWAQQTSPVSVQLSGIHFADGLWVAVGNAGTVVTSPDGVTWTDRTATSGTVQNLTEVGFFNGSFYYVGFGQTVKRNTAANIAANITPTNLNADVTSGLTGIATNGSRLLICGSVGAIATSDDGTAFTSRTGNATQMNGAAFGNGTYVVVGNAINGSGLIATVDPVTFAYQRRVGSGASSITGIRFLANKFFASSTTTQIQSSADGITWTPINLTGNVTQANDFAYNGSRLVVFMGQSGVFRTAFSDDGGNTFSSGVTIANNSVTGGAWANGVFVAVGQNGAIYTSTTGSNIPADWTLRTSGTTVTLFAVRYSTRDDQWYAAGDNGTILRSADAITWESIANDAVGAVLANGVIQSNPFLENLIPNQVNTIALRLEANDFAAQLNDGAIVTDLSGSMPSVNRLTFGFNGHIRKLQYFPSAQDL